MEKEVNISILQMASTIGNIEANLKKVEEIVSKELPTNCDTLVLPEVWTVGWDCTRFREAAQELQSGSVHACLSQLAKKYSINIIGGSYITKHGNEYFNTCPVYSKDGTFVTSYSKNHLYAYYGCNEDKYVSKGSGPVMVTLDGIKYGLTICYDIRFPEIYRAYMKNGADILINCAAWGSKKPIPWEMMTKSRAIENQCYMVALTQTGKINNQESNLGESRIIDYKGDEMAKISQREGIVSATLNIGEMYAVRKKSPTLEDIRSSYEVTIR